MNYDFEVTIKRIVNKTPHGIKLVFDGSEDLEEIFTPKIVSMLLKSWATMLEEKQGIIVCPLEQYRRKTRNEI